MPPALGATTWQTRRHGPCQRADRAPGSVLEGNRKRAWAHWLGAGQLFTGHCSQERGGAARPKHLSKLVGDGGPSPTSAQTAWGMGIEHGAESLESFFGESAPNIEQQLSTVGRVLPIRVRRIAGIAQLRRNKFGCSTPRCQRAVCWMPAG